MNSHVRASFPGLRPTRTRWRPRRASSSATARPMPSVAPVTTAHAPYRAARSRPGRRNARRSHARKVAADRTTTKRPTATSTANHTGAAGDEDEDGVDDLEGEFGLRHGGEEGGDGGGDPRDVAASMLRAHMSYGRGDAHHPAAGFGAAPGVPLLTNGQMVRRIRLLLLLLLLLLLRALLWIIDRN